MDDVALWSEGKSEQEVARKLSEAIDAALGWARESGVAFKTEAMFLSRRKKPMESVRVGGYEVQFNQHATIWLGIWIDSK